MTSLKYLTFEQFDCPYSRYEDTGYKYMDREILWMLDQAWHLSKIKFKILKGYVSPDGQLRTKELNNSSHLIGRAAEIRCKDPRKRYKMITALLEVGFTRIGFSEDRIYVDNDDMKPDSIWYFNKRRLLSNKYPHLDQYLL